MKFNVILIGFMGSGKSTIGKQLAKDLDMTFLDMDTIIQRNVDMTIHEIFTQKGESFFRNEERELSEKISSLKNLIVATGGGIVLQPENMEWLSKTGVIFYIKCDFDTIVQRIKAQKNRPLFSSNLEQFKDLFHSREHLYKKYTNQIVDVNKKSVKTLVDEIMQKIKIMG